MSTLLPTPPALLGPKPSAANTARGTYRVPRRFDGSRGLAAMLLAAAVAAMVVLADQMISSWADGHLFLGWVALWVVVFAGLALFADTARSLAARMLRSLDAWSQARAEARAESRLWAIAGTDPRLMGELMQARMRDTDRQQDFSEALAPLGVEPLAAKVPTTGWAGVIERMAESRTRNMHLYYI